MGKLPKGLSKNATSTQFRTAYRSLSRTQTGFKKSIKGAMRSAGLSTDGL